MKKNSFFPILSIPGENIDLYKLDNSSVEVEKEIFLCPHGWGKESDTNLNKDINLQKKVLKINEIKYSLFKDESLFENKHFVYRNYLNDDRKNVFYEKHKNNLKGKIYNSLHQLVAYTQNGLEVFGEIK